MKKLRFASRAVRLLIAVGIGGLLALILATAGLAALEQPSNALSPQGQSTLGDYVWYDTNLNGWPDAGESGIDGVLVKLWLDDNDGVFEPGGDDTLWGSMVTGDNPGTPETEHGWYDFSVTANGNAYWVEIDDSNFAPGGVLEGYVHTSAGTKGPEPMWVYLPDIVMDYDEADFGYALAGIDLVKVAGDAPDGETEYIPTPGAVVTYTYTVINTGETYLSNIVVTDDNGTGDPGDDFQVCSIPGPLAPGASQQCSWSGYVGADRTNWATAVGNPTDSGGNDLPGDDASDSDDAVVVVLGSIGDYIWNDANGNGLQDEGSGYGINGVTVNLYQGACPPSGSPYATTVTTGDGGYDFTLLPPGDYCVDVDESTLAPGYNFIPGTQSGPEPHDVSLGSGEDYDGADFGYAGRGTIAGIVWYDWNENGTQDLGEDGIEGVTVTLYIDLNYNGVPDAGEYLSQTLSIADGAYTFPGLLPGRYLVVEDNPPGYESSTPDVLVVQLIIVGPSGSDVDNNFGDLAWAGLGDFAYYDANGNGVQDPGETTGIEGVGLLIEGVDVLGQPFSAYTETNPSGEYLVGELVPGTYTVTVIVTPTGYVLTSDPVATTVLEPNESDLGLDFGFKAPTGFRVLDLQAELEGDVVRISWSVQSTDWWDGEFNVYRSETETGERVKVNDEPILASVPGNTGYAWYYAWYDMNAETGKTYYYWLESLSYPSMESRLFGPVRVEISGPGGMEILPWLYLPVVMTSG